MTDKEQIIIDGVDITGCAWCDFEPNAEPYCRINDGEDLGCEDNPNCYFKQLARKTSECEELEEQDYENLKIIHSNFNQIKSLRAENDRYRKALEEIEEFCITYSDNHDAYETVYKYILNIINKAEGNIYENPELLNKEE